MFMELFIKTIKWVEIDLSVLSVGGFIAKIEYLKIGDGDVE